MGLGHGGGEHAKELSLRQVVALAGKKVVGVSAGNSHTAVWTDAGELFTCGDGGFGTQGHGGLQTELVLRLVEALEEADIHSYDFYVCFMTQQRDQAGEIFTFGYGASGAGPAPRRERMSMRRGWSRRW
jgi:alpha-tubulin suppressor-like RCC1 family protein